MKILLMAALFASTAGLASDCLFSKEYVTFYRYLDSKENWETQKATKIKWSEDVSKGCLGAAERVIKIAELLDKAKVDMSLATKYALPYAQKAEHDVAAFASIFKEAYLEEYLDLDLKSALDLASKVRTSEKIKSSDVAQDFKLVVDFCLSNEGLHLSKNQCADLAVKLLNTTTETEFLAGKDFIETINFFNGLEFRELALTKKIEMASKLVATGKSGLVNLKELYDFSKNEKGLGFEPPKALNYTYDLIVKTTKKAK